MQDKKKGVTRRKMEKKWGKVTRDKKMGRRDARRKYIKKNGEMRQDMEKKWGDETRDEKKMGR